VRTGTPRSLNRHKMSSKRYIDDQASRSGDDHSDDEEEHSGDDNDSFVVSDSAVIEYESGPARKRPRAPSHDSVAEAEQEAARVRRRHAMEKEAEKRKAATSAGGPAQPPPPSAIVSKRPVDPPSSQESDAPPSPPRASQTRASPHPPPPPKAPPSKAWTGPIQAPKKPPAQREPKPKPAPAPESDDDMDEEQVVTRDTLQYHGLKRPPTRKEAPPPPPKTAKPRQKAQGKPFEFRLSIDVGDLLKQFMTPILSILDTVEWRIIVEDDFCGIKLGSLNSSSVIAIMGRMAMSLEPGVRDGVQLTRADLHGTRLPMVCDNLKTAIKTVPMKKSHLTITKYVSDAGAEELTFESVEPGGVARKRAVCPLAEPKVYGEGEDDFDNVASLHVDTAFEAKVQMSLLKNMMDDAKQYKTSDWTFLLKQCARDDLVHSRLLITYASKERGRGETELFITSQETETEANMKPNPPEHVWEAMQFGPEFRMTVNWTWLEPFFANKEAQFVNVHLPRSDAAQLKALVVDIDIGGMSMQTGYQLVLVSKGEADD